MEIDRRSLHLELEDLVAVRDMVHPIDLGRGLRRGGRLEALGQHCGPLAFGRRRVRGNDVDIIGYSQHKFRTAATTLLATVLDRYATNPLSPGATFWIPGVKTEIAAKKRRKNEQKWARYGR